jgi:hypothetical protein
MISGTFLCARWRSKGLEFGEGEKRTQHAFHATNSHGSNIHPNDDPKVPDMLSDITHVDTLP